MIAIKKYSNRRLYNTDTSSYITQDDIVNLIKEKTPFQITDVDTKKDITSSILMQILLEKQTAGTNLIPEEFLKQIIIFNENNQSADMFGFLSHVLNFANSKNIFTEGFGSMIKFNPFDFQKFFEFPVSKSNNEKKENPPMDKNEESTNINALSKQLQELQSQIEKLKKAN
ncbi:MAG: polyhydroxyalkanoate synthesis regulator DNA-binding domain-containing protein [Pelagibacteraceae bacterium]